MALNPDDTLLNGHYSIVRLLGRGGFGFVYLAQDTLLGEQVAIKELIPALVGDDSMLKRFLAEARATMRLTHKHIVRTHNVFHESGNYYIVMEYMAGGSLEERLRESGSLPVSEAVRVAAEVCEGLACAHEEQVVHCDLKPANILFDGKGTAKVADFGIAHVSGEMVTRSWMTPAGFVAGTLPYMSPEQAEGVRDEPRIDVYALGAVLYRMLTGRTYLEFDQRETPVAQADNVYRIRNQQPQSLSANFPQLPAWLDGVVLRALSKHPEDRYVNAGQMREALLQQPATVPDVFPSPLPPTRLIPTKPASGAPLTPAWKTPLRQAVKAASGVTKTSSLRAWFWPAAGAAAVLLVILIIAIGVLGRGRDREAVVGTRSTVVVTAAATAEFVVGHTETPLPEAPTATTPARTPTSTPPSPTPVIVKPSPETATPVRSPTPPRVEPATPATEEGVVIIRSSVGHWTGISYAVAGEVANQGATNVTGIKILGQFYDAQGQLLKTDELYADLGIVKAGEVSSFSAHYGDLPRPIERYDLTLLEWEGTAAEPVRVDVLRHEGAVDGMCYQVWGEVRNPYDVETSYILVYVTSYDSNREVIGVESALPDLWTLEPGQRSTFQIRECDLAGEVASYAVVAMVVQF